MFRKLFGFKPQKRAQPQPDTQAAAWGPVRVICLFVWFVSTALWTQTSFALTELEERDLVSDQVRQAFLREEFSQLEEMSRAYRTAKNRTASGLWKLTLFYSGILKAIKIHTFGKDRDLAFGELQEKTARWAQAYPDSPSAQIVLSMVLIKQGWAYRGGGYAHTVKLEAWAPFYKYIALGRENLERHKAFASADPRWYETMIEIAKIEGWERERVNSLLKEALDREPLFYQTYFGALEYLLPKWHGNAKDIEQFAQDAVKRTFKQEGRGMYARIYWYASQTQYDNALFAQSLASWSRMKDGFDDVIARYPDAWNLNNYAKFACLAKDKPKTRELLKRSDFQIVAEAWSPASLRTECFEWALQ